MDTEARHADLSAALRSLFAAHSSLEVVRNAEPLGFDARLWERLRTFGIPSLAVPEDCGGGGAGMSALAVIAEEAGRVLAPVPVVEALVGARLLASLGHADPEVLDGSVIATISLGHRLVPAAAVASVVVAPHDGGCVIARWDAPLPSPRNLGSLPIAEVDLTDGDHHTTVNASCAYQRGVDEWRVLTAAWLAGLGESAVVMGAEYAKQRRQFGVLIGTFQAVQSQLADAATAVTGARLLAHIAAERLDADPQDRRGLAAASFAASARAAQLAAGVALHVHGGYGYTMEYDIQMFVRRARAVSLLAGDPLSHLDTVAERRWPNGVGVTEAPAADEAHTTLRSFLKAHLTPEVRSRVKESGTRHDWEFLKAFASAGFTRASWPEARGGLGWSPAQQSMLHEELGTAAAPIEGFETAELVANVLSIVGDERQKELATAVLDGEVLIGLGYSEPEVGSDISSVSTKATKVAGGWKIRGQKMFTSYAHVARWVFLLARTNPDVPRHRGLSTFLVPLDAPGVEIQPIWCLGGERTNATFYDDVFVPDSALVGEVDGGWEVMKVALAFERQPAALHFAGRALQGALNWAVASGQLANPDLRRRLARFAVDIEVGRALGESLATEIAAGRLGVVEGSMAKHWCSEAFQRGAADLLDATGADGLLSFGDPDAPGDGELEKAYRHSFVTTIYGGTSEIQRSIVAERGLGLPRSR